MTSFQKIQVLEYFRFSHLTTIAGYFVIFSIFAAVLLAAAFDIDRQKGLMFWWTPNLLTAGCWWYCMHIG